MTSSYCSGKIISFRLDIPENVSVFSNYLNSIDCYNKETLENQGILMMWDPH